MAVGFDASSESHTGTTGSASQASFSWSHAGTANAKGVLIFVLNMDNSAGDVTSVTYGGQTVPAVSGAVATDTAGEAGRCSAFYLHAPPTGTQTVVVNRNNNANVMTAYAVTVTAQAGWTTEPTGVVLLQNDGTVAVQSVNDGSPGTNSMRFAAGMTGLAAPPAAGTGSTLLQSIDFGAFGAALARETTAGQGARNVGFTSGTSDDRAYVHLAIREIAPPTATSVLRVSLAGGSAPDVDTGHVIKVRARKTGGTGTVTLSAALYEGATNRSGNLTSSELTTSLATYSLPIGSTEVANITSYSDLEVRLWGDSPTGDSTNLEIADVWLETPAPSAPTDPKSASDSATLSESAAVAITLFVNASESHAQNEGTTTIAVTALRTESLTMGEAAAGTVTFTARTDSASLSEGTPAIQNTTAKSASDSLTLSAETAAVAEQALKAASDSAALSEATANLAALLDRNDPVAISEAAAIAAALAANEAAALSEGTPTVDTVDMKVGADAFTLNDGGGGAPVVLLGKTGYTGSDTNPAYAGNGQPAGFAFTASESGQVAALKVLNHSVRAGDPGITALNLGIYADNGSGHPGALLGAAPATGNFTTVGALLTATLSSPVSVVSGTTYHLALQPIGDEYSWEGTTGEVYHYGDFTSGLTALPDPFGELGHVQNAPAIWAETAGGGSAASITTTEPKTGADSAALTDETAALAATVAGIETHNFSEGPITLTLTGPSDAFTMNEAADALSFDAKVASDSMTMSEAQTILQANVGATDSLVLGEVAGILATTSGSDAAVTSELASAAESAFKNAFDSAVQNEQASVLQQRVIDATDDFAQSEVAAAIAAVLNASDASTLDEVALAAAFNFVSAADSALLSELADLDESFVSPYTHTLPPQRGIPVEYDLDGIVTDMAADGIDLNHVATAVIFSAIAHGIATAAEASGDPLDADASGDDEYSASGVNV